MNIYVKEAGADQLEGIYAIECACFSPPWSKEALGGLIGMDGSGILAALDEYGTVIGFLCYLDMYDALHIANIAVTDEYRGQGAADALIQAVVKICDARIFPDITLEVRISNKAAVSLYEKHGFITEGIRKEYYDDKEDAYIMWRRVNTHDD